MKTLVGLAVILLMPAGAGRMVTDTAGWRFERVMEQIVKGFNAADYELIDRLFSESMREFMPLEKSRAFFGGLLRRYGKILRLEEPRLNPPTQASYVAVCERGKLDIDLWLDNQGMVTGLQCVSHRLTWPVPKRNHTKLELPFKGTWFVVWGGDTKSLNIHHHDVSNQRFAFDFVGADAKGKTRRGRAVANEDHLAFGREILAPADGVVTDVIDGVRDNRPGSMNTYSALGNAVFIRHSEDEVSVLAHLKLNSVRVKVGEQVKAGQVIGLCGNSGNSSEPHLHYHLQNTPIIQEAMGIKCHFEKVIVVKDDAEESKEDYSPIKSDIVRGPY